MTYKAGTVLLWSAGSYSDYGICGLFTVLQDFTFRSQWKAYKTEWLQFHKRFNRDDGQLMTWLVLRGILAPLDYSEVPSSIIHEGLEA